MRTYDTHITVHFTINNKHDNNNNMDKRVEKMFYLSTRAKKRGGGSQLLGQVFM